MIELFNVEDGYAIFSKGNYVTKRHRHYLLEIVYCTAGSFNVVTPHHSYSNLVNIIIPPNLPHSFNCTAATCNLLFLDPLSDIGRFFMHHYHLAALKDVLVNVPELDQFHQNGEFQVSRMQDMAATVAYKEIDSRIRDCIQTINTLFCDFNVTVAQLSDASFLSAGRFSHLFKKQLGISVHQYILWKKISLAVQKSREGYSLTECAHYAGFTDSSHFHRVFKKMFGIKPFFVLKS